MALPQRHTSSTQQDWRALYRIENPADVDAYVAKYPIVASILTEAPARIAATFEEHPRLVLSCEFDPEGFSPIEDATDAENGPHSGEDEAIGDYLVVDIMTKRDADDAFARLNRFDESWWLNVIQYVARDGAAIVFNPRFT